VNAWWKSLAIVLGSGVLALGCQHVVLHNDGPGSLDKELIRRVIHYHRSQLGACYEARLKEIPALQGKLVVQLVIGPGGEVASLEVKESTLGDAGLEGCIQGKIRTWMFPKPRQGGVVTVTYPFIFKQSSKMAERVGQ
jgi:TonB family protein